jgi:hypothetical protein
LGEFPPPLRTRRPRRPDAPPGVRFPLHPFPGCRPDSRL